MSSGHFVRLDKQSRDDDYLSDHVNGLLFSLFDQSSFDQSRRCSEFDAMANMTFNRSMRDEEPSPRPAQNVSSISILSNISDT